MKYPQVVRLMFPSATDNDFFFQYDGKQTTIGHWNAAKLGKQPTIAELEAWAAAHAAELEAAEKMAARLAAYKSESDPLLAEALYDANRTDGKAVSITASHWYAKVEEIKERYPVVAAQVEK